MALLTVQVLIDQEEDVFRNIKIDTTNTLEELHLAILHAFEFEGDQMASLFLSDDNWEKGEEFSLLPMDEAVQGMADFTLDQLSLTKGSKLLYVYDFLRMWCFYIEVLEIEEGAQEFPNVVYSFGTAPKENSKEIEFDLGLDEDIQTTANEKKPYDLDDDELDNLSDSDMFDSLDDYENL